MPEFRKKLLDKKAGAPIFAVPKNTEGSVVQLVRMPPCHGGGRGFESRPVRKEASQKCGAFFVLCQGGGRPDTIRDPVHKKSSIETWGFFYDLSRRRSSRYDSGSGPQKLHKSVVFFCVYTFAYFL